jgi:hypothetical protein
MDILPKLYFVWKWLANMGKIQSMISERLKFSKNKTITGSIIISKKKLNITYNTISNLDRDLP